MTAADLTVDQILDAANNHVISFALAWDASGDRDDPVVQRAREKIVETLNKATKP